VVYFPEFISETAVDILDEFVVEYQQLISGWIYAVNTPRAVRYTPFPASFFLAVMKLNNFKDQSHSLSSLLKTDPPF
jgi:hypothetical protein